MIKKRSVFFWEIFFPAVKKIKRRKLKSLIDASCHDPKRIEYMREAWESCVSNKGIYLNNQVITNHLISFSNL